MIIVDTALKKRAQDGNPIRVAMVGAGYVGQAIAYHLLKSVAGMRLVAISNRTLARAQLAYRNAGVDAPRQVHTAAALEDAIEQNQFALTDDPMLLCRAGPVEAIIEVTGDLELGARVALEAIQHGKHVIHLNASVDSTVGSIIRVYADRAGVIYTYSDGDEPGVAMNLYRFVQSIGCRPVLMGQIKGFLDRYRNPDTQRAFAERVNQRPAMIASYADGSKLAVESTIMGNATGFTPKIRGMCGYECAHVRDLLTRYSADDFRQGGFVDFVLGAEPHSGAFVMGYNDEPIRRPYMSMYKMGDGPLYMFYTPFHLAHLQLPHSVARAVLFHDATLAARGAPVCDTLSVAKRDLRAGAVLDGMGGFDCYGLIESYALCQQNDFLPIPVSEGCRLKRDIPKDQPIRCQDVELPAGRLSDKLRAEQTARFGPAG